ncbi:hypothetical protein ZOSMA_1G03420 [Zostera marina]|uniref:Pentatricopeptide repeat-containing protein n=1 Tax=Zostera marina TaxID=29655 RepID=A0A0K9PQ43_ZOSMR|nr:hypothetical protein ZOSMA_1G03420 [Zostera marina]
MLSKLYACVGRWEDVCTVRRRIRAIGADKDHRYHHHHPGLSWIEIKDRFHVFSADDELHEHVEDARFELRRMKMTMIGLQQDYKNPNLSDLKCRFL